MIFHRSELVFELLVNIKRIILVFLNECVDSLTSIRSVLLIYNNLGQVGALHSVRTTRK